MRRAFAIVFVVAVVFSMIGCGGGGKSGGGNQPPVTPPVTQPITPPDGSIVVKPGTPLRTSTEDFTIEGSSDTFTSVSIVAVQQTTPTGEERPENTLIDCSSVEVRSSAKVQSAITVAAKQTRGIGGITYLLLHREGPRWAKVSESEVGRFLINPADFAQNGPNWICKFLIGKIEVLPVSKSTSMRVVVDDPSAKQKTNVLVVVNGFCDSGASFDPYCNWVARRHQYRRIYTFEYDWRAQCFDSSESLANAINQLKTEGYTLDILGHSMGATIARHAMERHGASSNVLHYFGICGAHLGSSLAATGELIAKLQDDWINRALGDLPFGWPTGNIPSFADMIPGSNFLRVLNDSWNIAALGTASYILVSTRDDDVVGEASGSARGIKLREFTTGLTEVYVEPGDHSNMVKTPDGWRTMNSCIAYFF